MSKNLRKKNNSSKNLKNSISLKENQKNLKTKTSSENKKSNSKTKTNITKKSLLNNKKIISPPKFNSLSESDDSSDEEVLVRTGNVPDKWYDTYQHIGYDINSNKVIKNEENDEIEKFLEKASNKNWWRNIFDPKNNRSVYLSDNDLNLIKRIINHKFANKKIADDVYFEENIPYQTEPINPERPKRKGPSKYERKMINRFIYLYKNGFLSMESNKNKKNENENVFDIWEFENDNLKLNNYNPTFGYQMPERELPDNEISYNPPNNNNINFLRKIPRYENLLEEEMERLVDLFLSSRTIKKKTEIKEKDLLPDLPKPEELKPFPSKEIIIYKGHESSIRALCVNEEGNVIISADNGNFVFFSDVQTSKILYKIDFKEKIIKIEINQFLHFVIICTLTHIFFLLPKYLEKKIKNDIIHIVNEKIYPAINNFQNENKIDEENLKDESKTINNAFEWKIPKKNSKKEKNNILFYMKWKQGKLKNFIFHNKGDYFATLTKNSSGKTNIFIHSLTKMTYQLPISHIKGNVNNFIFHPKKPYFIVCTNSNIFIYNLQKQELIRKFVSNLNTINQIDFHKEGSDLIVGDKSGKVAWFQVELSNKPFKLMDYHGDKIKSIQFHKKFPIFLSCSRNGKLLIYYGKVTEEEIKDPLIVPLKVLKAKNTKNENYTCACFHTKQPWVFTGGEDGKIRCWA